MRTVAAWIIAIGFLTGAPSARAGEAPCTPVFGIESLCRTPVDLAFDFGASFYDYDMTSAVHIFQEGFVEALELMPGDGVVLADDHPGNAKETIDIDPETLLHGVRASGGLAYELFGLTFEPAVAFSVTHAVSDKEEKGPTDRDRLLEVLCCVAFIEWHTLAKSEVEFEFAWDLAFGTTISIPSPLSRPIVFFPFMGVAEARWRVDLIQAQKVFFDSPDPEFLATREDDDFDETFFLIGFDLDIPLPGTYGPLQHDLVLGFKWLESTGSGDHRFSAPTPSGLVLPFGRTDYRFDGIEGARFELRYRVTFADLSGSIHRLFGGG